MPDAKKSKPRQMKSYASFALWKADQSKKNQALIVPLQKLVKASGLSLIESVKWGNGVWLHDELPIAFCYAMSDGVQFGFFAGSVIDDPQERLQGQGKHVRAVHIHNQDGINPKYFAALLKKAIKIKYR